MSAGGRKAIHWRLLVLLLVVTLVGKAALQIWLSDSSTYWTSGYSFYHRMAVEYLRRGQLAYGQDGLYPCFRLPGYPVFVAAISWLTNDSPVAFIIAQAMVSTGTVGLVYWISRGLASQAAALAAAALYGFFPYAFVHDTRLQENGLYNALSTLGIAIFLYGLNQHRSTRWMLMAGLATGAAVLTRGPHLIPAMVLPIALWMTSKRPRAQNAFLSAIYLTGLFVVIAPWMARNYSVSGRLSLTSQAGFSFGVSHNPSTFDFYPYRGSIDQSWAAYHHRMPGELRDQLDGIVHDEFRAADWYRREALMYIQEHPLETIRRGLVKVFVNFAGVLSPLADPVKNWTYFVSFWALTILAVPGLSKLRGTQFWTLFWALMLAQAAFSFVYYAHTSHRSYLDPLLGVPAGIGLTTLFDRLSARRNVAAKGAKVLPGS